MANLAIILIGVLLASIIVYLSIEFLYLQKSLRKIPIRILVNGTRGKTITVRMMHRMFLANHYRASAKTTGDEPVLWLPNDQSEIIHRRAPANIIENLRYIRRSAHENTQVAILECMALRPETQYTLAWKLFKPTHTFITNIGNDHFEAMGENLPEIAAAMMQSTTINNILFIPSQFSDSNFKAKRIEIFEAENSPADDLPIAPAVLNSQWGLMRAFISHFGLDFETGVRIFKQLWAENFERIHKVNPDKNYTFWNFFSVNDTDSAERLITHILPEINQNRFCIAVFNARRDRPLRSESFARMLHVLPTDTVIWITGSGTFLTRRLFRKYLQERKIELVAIRNIVKKIQAGFNESTCLIGLGNSRGTESIIRAIAQV